MTPATALDLVGALTILATSIGGTLAVRHYRYFRGSDALLARRLRYIYMTDALIYGATLLFGLWASLALSAIQGDAFWEWARVSLYVVRLVAIVVNIAASARLYAAYRIVGNAEP